MNSAILAPPRKRPSQQAKPRRTNGSLEIAAFRTVLGWMAAVGRDETLAWLAIGHDSERAGETIAEIAGWRPPLIERLQAFAEGEPDDFRDVEVDLDHLTPFHRRAIEACRQIPWGRTLTYAELAAKAGAPGAARAVGNAMASNRVPLVVPCHRVVASGGGLGGYSAPQGLSLKKRLLALEDAG